MSSPGSTARPDAPAELEFALPGLTLAARAWGPPEGRPVLALHGWLDSAASFDALAPLLPGLRLVCLDLPGHGRSGHRHATAGYDFVHWLPDALAAADALGWRRFAVLGHSLGASIGLCLAGLAPERVERALLIDGLGPLVAPAEDAPGRIAAAIAARQRLAGRTATTYASLDEAVAHKHRALPGLSLEAARTLTLRGIAPGDDGRLAWRHDPRLRGPSLLRLTEEQVRAFLRRVACPVLVVRPRDGWPVEQAEVRRRLDCLGDVALIEVEGGHHVHLDHPGRIAARALAFLGA